MKLIKFRYRNKVIFTVLFSCLLCFSCEKDLDLEPKNNLSSSLFFKTENDFKLWANQYYTSLPAFLWGRDDWSDITYQPGGNIISRGQHLAPDRAEIWTDAYTNIRNQNFLLQEAETAPEEIREDIKVYVAEAKFFRAFTYFNMLRQYGGVPIVEGVLDLQSEELFAPRNSRAELTDFILNDLDEAAIDLPLQSELGGGDLGRVTRGAALAFKSRVALFAGTWAKYHNTGQDVNDLLGQAASAANQVIAMEGSEYELFDERISMGDESFRYLFILEKVQSNPGNFGKGSQREFILTARYDNEFRSHTERPESVLGTNPTKKYMDLVLCADGLPIDRSPLFIGHNSPTDEYTDRDPRMINNLMVPFERYYSSAQEVWTRDWSNPDDPNRGFFYEVEFGLRTATGYVPTKFLSENVQPLGFNWPVIRYAEVLLNYAEAVYERDGAISDADLDLSINKLRDRVGMPSLHNAFVSANGLTMQEEIRRERTVELFLEGFRYDDLRRWKTAEFELPQAVKGVKYTGTEYETDPRWADFAPVVDVEGFIVVEEAGVRTFDPVKHYLFALPRAEIAQNPALEQNPGWE